MLISDAKTQLFAPLVSLYGEQEAQSLWWLLLENATGKTRLHLRMSAQEPLSSEAQQTLVSHLQRLLAQEPLQYITGEAHFYGYDFRVSPAVLIPRRETEELVHWAIEIAAQQHTHLPEKKISAIDIGTGSGCIPISLALELAKKAIAAEISAIDISPEALVIAQQNSQTLGATVDFRQQDILTYLAPAANSETEARFSLVLSNPPYIPPQEFAEMPDNVRHHEPHLALFAPPDDALAFYRAVGNFAQQHLMPGGWLLVEIHEKFGAGVAELFATQGFQHIQVRHDMQGKVRMVGAQKVS